MCYGISELIFFDLVKFKFLLIYFEVSSAGDWNKLFH